MKLTLAVVASLLLALPVCGNDVAPAPVPTLAPAPVAVQATVVQAAPVVVQAAPVQVQAVQVQAVQQYAVVQSDPCCQPVQAVAVQTVAYAPAPVQALETKLTWRQRRALKKANREARFMTVQPAVASYAAPVSYAQPVQQYTLGMEVR